MSYILDALRRAESEREHGRVPSIHAQTNLGSGAIPRPDHTRRQTLQWAVALAGTVLVLVALVAWLALRPETPVVAINTAAPASSSTWGTTPTPIPTPTSAWPEPSVTPPTRVLESKSRGSPDRSSSVTRATPARKSSDDSVGKAMTNNTSNHRVYSQSELPDDIRRQLPTVSIGGSMYSPVPADRILIVNGQVLHEGQRITPELQLLQIKLKAMVLGFRGYRYEVAF